jgi:acyl-coenzyme A thioesterase PaaI-like protein
MFTNAGGRPSLHRGPIGWQGMEQPVGGTAAGGYHGALQYGDCALDDVLAAPLPEAVPPGWTLRPTKAFATHAGPFYAPPGGDVLGCGFVASPKHGNKRGVVHGGMLMTAFDVALGNASWTASAGRPCATVQLNISFVGAVKMGDFVQVRAEIIKATRSMVFLRGTMLVGERVVATADGVWKILEWRGEAFNPDAIPDGLPASS